MTDVNVNEARGDVIVLEVLRVPVRVFLEERWNRDDVIHCSNIDDLLPKDEDNPVNWLGKPEETSLSNDDMSTDQSEATHYYYMYGDLANPTALYAVTPTVLPRGLHQLPYEVSDVQQLSSKGIFEGY